MAHYPPSQWCSEISWSLFWLHQPSVQNSWLFSWVFPPKNLRGPKKNPGNSQGGNRNRWHFLFCEGKQLLNLQHLPRVSSRGNILGGFGSPMMHQSVAYGGASERLRDPNKKGGVQISTIFRGFFRIWRFLFGPFLVVFFDNGWKLKEVASYPALTKQQSLQVQLHSHSLQSSNHHEFSVENSSRNVTGLIQRVFFHVGCRRQIRGKVLFHGSGGFAPETGESAMAPFEIFFPNSKGILQQSSPKVF